MSASRLVLGAVLLNTVVAAALAAALASFAGQALGQAAHRRIETAPVVWIALNGSMNLHQAQADSTAIRDALHATFGPVPVTLYRSVWSDSLGLPAGGDPPGGRTAGGAQAGPVRRPPAATGPVALMQAAALDHLRAMATLVSGSWPASRVAIRPGRPIPAALPAGAARLLHLRAGRVLSLRDRSTGAAVAIRVTGIFRPLHPSASYWGLNLVGGSGASEQGGFVTYGPLVVDRGAFARGDLATGAASWLAQPDRRRIGGNLTALAGKITAMTSALGSPRYGGLQVTTGLPGLLSGMGRNLVVSRSVLVIGGLMLLVLVAAALLLASRVLAGQREPESALLSARGGSPGQLTRLNAAESGILAVTAAVAGALLGGWLAVLLTATGPLQAAGIRVSAHPPAAWWAAAAAALVCVAITLGPALRPARPGAVRQRRGRPAVLAGVARAGGDAALVALALLAGWQLRRYSVLASAGGLGVDPVLVVAPALALVAGTVLLLRLLPVLARAGDRLASRSRRLLGPLAIWEISRNPVRKSGAALLVVLAVATGTLVLSQYQSWQRSARDQAAFAVGADVRVDTQAPVPLGRAGTVAHARGVLGAMPVTRLALAATGSTLIALGARQAAGTVLLRPDLSPVPPAALWRRLIPAATPGIVLPGRPARLEIAAALGPAALRLGSAPVSVSVQDGSGAVYSVPAGTMTADGRRHDLVAVLSAARQAAYPLRLLAISASYPLPAANPHRRATLTLNSAAVSDRAAGAFGAPFTRGRAFRAWTPAVSAPSLGPPAPAGSAGSGRPVSLAPPTVAGWGAAAAGAQRLSFRPGFGQFVTLSGSAEAIPGDLALTAGRPRIPVIPGIATQGYLRASQATVGGTIRVTVNGVAVPVRIVAAVGAFPTVTAAGGALLVDQASLSGILVSQSAPPLQVSQWWLRSRSAGVPPALPRGAAIASRERLTAALLADPLSDVPQQALLAIAFAAALLAAVGFAVSVVTDAARHGQRNALLAALGLSSAQQARLHGAQELMLSVPAAGIGVLLGGLLARLLIPAVTLTADATRPVPPVLVEFSWAWAVLLGVTVAAVPALAAAVAAARRPDPASRLRVEEEG